VAFHWRFTGKTVSVRLFVFFTLNSAVAEKNLRVVVQMTREGSSGSQT
jgi:hypothetical protein